MYLREEWITGLRSQLDDLMDPENWEEDDTPITDTSFTTFLRMILLLKPIRRPGIGSKSNGVIIAAWINGQDRLIIECLPDDKTRWFASHIVNGVCERGSGETQLVRLPDVLASYNPAQWFF